MDPVTLSALVSSAAANAGTIASVASLASGGLAAAGSIAQANAAEAAAKAQLGFAEAAAADERAVAGRKAAMKAKETRLLMSRAQAVAADSGGKATDPTVLELMGGIAKEGNVASRELMRQGEEAANMTRWQGKMGLANAKTNTGLSYLQATGQLMSGVSDAFTKYGSGIPKTDAAKTADNSGGDYSSSWWLQNYNRDRQFG
jgi:hypothetical protein